MAMTRIDLKYCSVPDHYYTDLDKVRGVINAWAEGYSATPPYSPYPDHVQPHPDHERIQSRTESFVSPDLGHRLWLMSNWVQIALNIKGALIIVDYTYDYLCSHYYDPGCPSMEEIVNHVILAKESVPEASVWSPEAWTMFPLTSAPGDLQVPF